MRRDTALFCHRQNVFHWYFCSDGEIFPAQAVMTTEPCLTSTIEKAMKAIAKLDCMWEKPLCLKILVADEKPE